MSILSKLERKFGRFGIPNLTLMLILPQVAIYILTIGRPEMLDGLRMIPERVLQGEWWRIITFLIIPPASNPFFAFFFWYMFYIMGTALEGYWGTFRYNVYLLIGFVATIGVSFLTPAGASSNTFLEGSVFLAFAFLYPDFQILILFLFPVKIKWIALLWWIFYIYTIVVGAWISRLLVLSSICNFLVFFSNDILHLMKTGRRQMEGQARRFGSSRKPDEPYHRCQACGITDKTHPDMDFRYCPDCQGTYAYCTEHLKNHEHLSEKSV